MSQVIKESEVPLKCSVNQEAIVQSLFTKIQGSVKSSNPFMVKNIIPLPAFVYLATNLAVSLYMPNAVTGEDAAESLNAEIACASAIAKLADISPERAAGVFTFGGTGTNLYAHKISLMKVAPKHGLNGLKSGDIVIVGSRPSHYCHQTSVNWLGVGQDNYLQAGSYIDQTTKLNELEKICRDALSLGKKVACIEAVGGTTSNMAIDDIEAIHEIRERLVREFKLTYRPHIHVDSVVGWAYLNFVGYNFENNQLQFSKKIIEKIRKIVSRISKLKFADSFGVDFHKTGYVPYVSSMIIVKDRDDFSLLRRDSKIMTPLFHDDLVYNPGVFTLETSRSAANILATWMTLQTLGREGYQALLGYTLEISEYIREEIEKYEKYGLYVANKESFGCDIFIRCYPPNIDSRQAYEKELYNDRKLKIYTDYTNRFAKWLSENKSSGDEGIALSKSSAAFYTHTGSPMVALRIYSLNPHITRESAKVLVMRLLKAKIEFDKNNI
jgi:glutamate/tyrosine decarboxylase-like PLP-dependent enzyme